jgi:hypothetical protein
VFVNVADHEQHLRLASDDNKEVHANDSQTFRFGIQLFSTDFRALWQDLARQAEDLGYDVADDVNPSSGRLALTHLMMSK